MLLLQEFSEGFYLKFFCFKQTAEALHVKGFADVADKESFSAALLTQQTQSTTSFAESRQYSDELSQEHDDGVTAAKRKRQRHESNSSQSKSVSQEVTSPNSPQSRRQNFQSSREATGSSYR